MPRPKTDLGPEAFSPIEEEFFRAGDALSAEAAAEWSRLVPPSARPVTDKPADEEWDWQIAIARARHSTSS